MQIKTAYVKGVNSYFMQIGRKQVEEKYKNVKWCVYEKGNFT